MNMKEKWLDYCVDMACSQKDMFWTGGRKVFNNRVLKFDSLDDSLEVQQLGYTNNKITRLQSQYFVKDQIDTAIYLHGHNIRRKKYASASFSTYGHLLKASYENRSSAGSVMGPCIQSVVLTLRPHERRTMVDIFYRTTELQKKFPADLVWLRRNVFPLIPGQDEYPLNGFNFHVVNITAHSMYVATILPMLPDGIATLELIRDKDPIYWRHTGVWLTRYIIGGACSRGLESFAQSKRTADSARALMAGPLEYRVVKYLYKHRAAFAPRRTRFDQSELDASYQAALERTAI